MCWFFMRKMQSIGFEVGKHTRKAFFLSALAFAY